MPNVATPAPISDAVEETATGMFGVLDEDLKIKCRYHYAQAKIEARQKQGEKVPPSLMERHEEIEQTLKDRGISPATLIR